MRRSFPSSPWILFALLAPVSGRSDEVFDAAGFNRNRDYFSQLPYEHIDPMTGNLLLTFTDLVLPGNGGFDLKIQRSYNSKIYRNYSQGQTQPSEDTWAGIGWTLHLGRIPDPSPLPGVPPPLEMPDGSRHAFYRHIDGSGRFITREFWVYDRNTSVLKLTNGVQYTFGKLLTLPSGQTYRYVTRIDDPFGNTIDVQYMNAPAPPDGIASITQSVGDSAQPTRTRTVTFVATTDALRRLQSMTFSGRTWNYSQVASVDVGHSLLIAVTPPVGAGWGFTYNTATIPRYELTKLTTPQGGEISYAYVDQVFRLGSTVPVTSRVVRQRTTGGRDVPGGPWTYQYGQGSAQNQSIITGPCNRTVHAFAGIGNFTTIGAAWRVGLPTRREAWEGAALLQAEDLTWRSSAPVSNDPELIGNNSDPQIYVPLSDVRRITRGPRVYETRNTYGSANFNDYGRPSTIAETGELLRTTTRTFQYGFAPRYIVDKLASDTVTVGMESFTRSYTYDLTTGVKRSETIYGITRDFTADTWGNIRTARDANNHTRQYEYSWGQVSKVVTPTYNPLLTRLINIDGTTASETRRSFTTFYEYDSLSRPTKTTPPLGNPAITQYDNTGFAESVRVSRGPSFTDTLLDGFGRPSGTANGVGVKTDLGYDACGRRNYESLPFTGTGNTGTSYAFDGLGRLKTRTNPDATSATFAYSNGVDVTITNERNKTAIQDFSSFGDPDDARLVSIEDADNKIWVHSYNAVGNLTLVDPPNPGLNRGWSYNTKNQLVTESHPESGTVTYTYDPAGNLKTRMDQRFGQTIYGYDSDDRLVMIDRPGTAYDTIQAWDASNNRTSVVNGFVSSAFGYDASNRLLGRTDAQGGQTFVTGYTYDGNDNPQRIDYPAQSGLSVSYTYDAENRLTDVRRTGAASAYASAFTYHSSGAPLSFVTGNGESRGFTYDARHRPWTIVSPAFSLTYDYDNVGNVETIDDTRPGMDQTFTYDSLDRLLNANGFWGAGQFTHDAVGNRASKTVGGATSYTYEGSTGRLHSAGTEIFTYDLNGNLLTSSAGASFTYTPENMQETSTVGGVLTTYRYDGDQMRKLKLLGARTSYFVHDPRGQILSEFEATCPGQLLHVRDHLYAGGRLIGWVRPSVPPVTVEFAGGTSNVSEGAGTHQVLVRFTTANQLPTPCLVTVDYQTTQAGNPVPGGSGTRQFQAGIPHQGTQPISIPIPNDDLCGSGTALQVRLSTPAGAALGATTLHTVNVTEDDLVCVSGTKAVAGIFAPDGPITYSITLTNGGSRPQLDRPGAEFVDVLPPELRLDNVSASSGTAVANLGTNTVTWDGSIAVGSPVSLTIGATIRSSAANQIISNRGEIHYDLHDSGSNTATGYTEDASAGGPTVFQVESGPVSFYTVAPCRLIDTRNPAGPLGGPALQAGVTRVFAIPPACQIPAAAKAISVNVTVTGSSAAGNLRLFAAGIPPPLVSTVNYAASQTRGNNALVHLNLSGELAVRCSQGFGTAHVIIDVNGYFE